MGRSVCMALQYVNSSILCTDMNVHVWMVVTVSVWMYDYHCLHEEMKQDGQGPRASDGRPEGSKTVWSRSPLSQREPYSPVVFNYE